MGKIGTGKGTLGLCGFRRWKILISTAEIGKKGIVLDFVTMATAKHIPNRPSKSNFSIKSSYEKGKKLRGGVV